MTERVRAYIQRHKMLSGGELLLCAVSGGADSMVMLDCLSELAPELNLRLEVAHFNHRLRGAESQRDEDFVRDFCREKGLRLHLGAADVATEAKKRGLGIEETARVLRYGFLQSTLKAGGGDKIATAHNADDNAETVLMNMTRGSALKGLCGIPPVRGSIIRPLLSVSRSQIEAYAAEKGLDYVDDSTNVSLDYTRNRLRSLVIPVLKGINPALTDSIANMTSILSDDEAFFAAMVEKLLDDCEFSASQARLPASLLLEQPPSISRRLLMELMRRLGVNLLNVGSASLESILALCRGPRPSASLDLPGGLKAYRQYDYLCLSTEKAAADFVPLPLEIGKTAVIDALGLEITAEIVPDFDKKMNSLDTFFIKHDIIVGGLRLRPRLGGDRISLPGKPGSRSLKRLMIDEKIPQRRRDLLPVICDDEAVIAVFGLGVDRDYMAAEGGAAISLRFVFTNSVDRPRAFGPV